jgi:hypothetical protein
MLCEPQIKCIRFIKEPDSKHSVGGGGGDEAGGGGKRDGGVEGVILFLT